MPEKPTQDRFALLKEALPRRLCFPDKPILQGLFLLCIRRKPLKIHQISCMLSPMQNKKPALKKWAIQLGSDPNDWLILLRIYHAGRLCLAIRSMSAAKFRAHCPPMPVRSLKKACAFRRLKYIRGTYQTDLVESVLHQVRIPEWCRSGLIALAAWPRPMQP